MTLGNKENSQISICCQLDVTYMTQLPEFMDDCVPLCRSFLIIQQNSGKSSKLFYFKLTKHLAHNS